LRMSHHAQRRCRATDDASRVFRSRRNGGKHRTTASPRATCTCGRRFLFPASCVASVARDWQQGHHDERR
jgi:hypothetical protein